MVHSTRWICEHVQNRWLRAAVSRGCHCEHTVHCCSCHRAAHGSTDPHTRTIRRASSGARLLNPQMHLHCCVGNCTSTCTCRYEYTYFSDSTLQRQLILVHFTLRESPAPAFPIRLDQHNLKERRGFLGEGGGCAECRMVTSHTSSRTTHHITS